MTKKSKPVRGLESVVAAQTALSFVDGQNGKLYYRGYNIDQLAGKVSFEEVVHLLWFGNLPDADTLADFRRELVSEMRIPSQVYDLLHLVPPSANPMIVLRTAVSSLGMFDPDGGKNTEKANLRKACRILAQVATVVANLHRIGVGKTVLSPDPRMGFADNFLYMFRGSPPRRLGRDVLDTTLVLHADHGLAASTFAARVTVSTLAGMHSAIVAALGCLKGPLHGGANRKVMEMLEEIEGIDRVQSYINSMLGTGKRVMGFGHRIYKTEDPRSRHLKKFSERLARLSGTDELYKISHRIEETVMEKKGIYPNVDFYSATVQRALGIPKEYYTCVFSVARTAGWIAHILEQFSDNRLIRPTSNYIGGFDRKFLPLKDR